MTQKKNHTTVVKDKRKKTSWTNTDSRIFHEKLDYLYEEYERVMIKTIEDPRFNKKYMNHAITKFKRISKAVTTLKKVTPYRDNSEYNEWVRKGCPR